MHHTIGSHYYVMWTTRAQWSFTLSVYGIILLVTPSGLTAQVTHATVSLVVWSIFLLPMSASAP